MARFARLVVPGCAHHVTQRGNHRQEVFFCDNDRRTYLAILRDHCQRFGLRVAAWCLMTNHVHLVVIPAQEDSLARALGQTHNEYARWLHVRQRQVGHLWQNRFHSCPLAEDHLWEAIRYIELNPVRAGLVRDAAEWCWSSARAHLEGQEEWCLTDLLWWRERWTAGSWQETLASGLAGAAFIERLREATRTGRPFGSAEFTDELERETGRRLRQQKRGPKPKPAESGGQMCLAIP
jgi:REP-associated tyrosine transposase